MMSLDFLCDHALISPTSYTSPHIHSEEDSNSVFVVDNTFS